MGGRGQRLTTFGQAMRFTRPGPHSAFSRYTVPQRPLLPDEVVRRLGLSPLGAMNKGMRLMAAMRTYIPGLTILCVWAACGGRVNAEDRKVEPVRSWWGILA